MAEFERKYNAELQEEEGNSEKVVAIDRISRTVAGGRRIRFRALIVLGAKDNQVGVGMAKGSDVQKAVQKARLQAKKTMITIPVVDGTIPRPIEYTYGNTKVILKPAPMGHSIIAGGTVRSVLERAGIKNIVSKTLGSTNKLNTTMAAYMALKKLINTKLPVKTRIKND